MKRLLSLSVLWLAFLCIWVSTTGCLPQVHHKEPIQARVIVDDVGRSVPIPNEPKRIVTLTSAFDAVLVDLVDPSRIVAVSRLAKYKGFSLSWEKARQVPQNMPGTSLEGIIKLEPDLVIAPDFTSKDVLEGLEGMGIPVVVLQLPKTVDETLHLIVRMAEVVQAPKTGFQLTVKIREQIAYLGEKSKAISEEQRKTVLFESGMSGYAGTGSLFDDMCNYIAIDNASRKAGYPPHTPFTDERVLQMDPDVLLIPTYKGSNKKWVAHFTENPAFAPLKARQTGQVKKIPAAYLYTANQFIGDAMIRIMSETYPHLFTEEDRRRYPLAYET